MASSRLPVFQEKFKELRGDLTQQQFADKLGLSRPTIGLYESGARIPDAEVLRTIAIRCNVSVDYLLGLSVAPTRDRSIEGAVSVTGLNEKSICFLNDHRKDHANVLKALNLLLDDENPDNYKYWDRLQRYLFALPGDCDIFLSLDGIETTREEIFATLLTANSAYIKDLRDRLRGGGKNG